VTLRQLPEPLIALLMAVLIVTVAYPEVVFLGGSLSPAGLNAVVDNNARHRTVQVYPNTPSRDPKAGVQDLGARVWQLVPATKFVHRSFEHDESISWNPYSAAGSLGPETLADLKLSPFVLLVALFGASATAFTFVALAFVVLALYCLQRFFLRTLGLGRVAAVAGCLAFLFTGFGASGINSSVGAPYVLFPVVLYTLTEWRRVSSVPRLLAAVAAYAGFALTTFVPVQLLMLLFVHVITTSLDLSNQVVNEGSAPQRILRSIAQQLVIPAITLGLTAFAWLPIFDALRHAGSDVAAYGERELASSGKLRMLKIASPWLSNAKKWVGYVGIAPVILIAASWSRARPRERRILTVCIVLGVSALALHAGLPVITSIGNLPGLRGVRRDYWASVSGAAATVSLGIAVAVIGRKGANVLAATIVGVAIGLGVLLAWLVNVLLAWNAVPGLGLLAALAVIAVAVAIARASRQLSRRPMLAIASVALVAVELFSYQNHARLERSDFESSPPAYVTYLLTHVKTDRILNAGRNDLYAEWGSVFGIRQIETLNTMQVPAYRTFFQRYVNPQEKSLFLQIGGRSRVTFKADPDALNVLSVRYLVIDQSLAKYDNGVRAHYSLAFADPEAGVNVYRNAAAFPNVYLSPALTDAKKPGAWSRPVTQTDDRTLLAAARAAHIPAIATANARPGIAHIENQTNTEVRIEVKARQPSVLVLTDSDYRNWTATVDGTPAHIGRVNDVVRGIVVPRGELTVVFHYHSSARSLGEVISLVTLGGLVLFALATALRRRRTRT
jgi:hypothetical protein